MPHTQKTISARQLAANQANAAHSSGPKTPEGKARPAQNSTKHGFTASTFAVVRLEDANEIAHLKDDLLSVRPPQIPPASLPNEPICTLQPKQNSATYPISETNPSDGPTPPNQPNQPAPPNQPTPPNVGHVVNVRSIVNRPGERSSPAA